MTTKTRRRVIGWRAIGELLGLTAEGARTRHRKDPAFQKIVRKTRTGRPWVFDDAAIAYDRSPAR